MNHSETLGELAKALATAQGQMNSAKKDAANPFFKSRYADLSSIVDAIKEPLSKNCIAYVQTTDIDEAGVVVETTLIHSSGQWISGRLRMVPVKNDPQGIGSCITYARRYGLQAICGLDADDDDGNAASGNVEKPKAEHKPEPKQKPPEAQGAANNGNGTLTKPAGISQALFDAYQKGFNEVKAVGKLEPEMMLTPDMTAQQVAAQLNYMLKLVKEHVN